MRVVKIVGLILVVALLISGFNQCNKLPKIPSRPTPVPAPSVEPIEPKVEPPIAVAGFLERTIQKPGSAMLPEVDTFFREHPEFGKPTTVYESTRWAKGICQRVRTDTEKNLLVYLKDGVVVSVNDGATDVWPGSR